MNMERIKNKLENIANTSIVLCKEIDSVSKEIDKERENIENEYKKMATVIEIQASRIQLDVGGSVFATSLTTLQSVSIDMKLGSLSFLV